MYLFHTKVPISPIGHVCITDVNVMYFDELLSAVCKSGETQARKNLYFSFANRLKCDILVGVW